MRYLIYLRVSSTKQDEKTQLDLLVHYLQNMTPSGFEHEIFRDSITSKKGVYKKVNSPDGGHKMEHYRQGFKDLMQVAKRGDTIVAMRLDRISRIATQSHVLLDELEEKGIHVILAEQPKLTNKILLGLYAGMAEEEVALLRERVTETLEVKKMRGERRSGHIPYGQAIHPTKKVIVKRNNEHVMVPGVLIENPQEKEAISHMVELFSLGLSYGNIAKSLWDMGYANREGNPFHKSSVSRILARQGYKFSRVQSLSHQETLENYG